MSNTFRVAIAPEVYVAKCAQLKAQYGLDIAGTQGTIEKDGIKVVYLYDGVGFFSGEVTEKPWEDPMELVVSKLTAWLEAPVTTAPVIT